MQPLLEWLVDPAGLAPHGFCLLWQPGLIWAHMLADSLVGLSYAAIPLVLLQVARRRPDLVHRPVLIMFAAFILLCGAGHWMDLLTLWVPAYGAQAVVKAATALASVATALALWKLRPRILALPSPRQMRRANQDLAQQMQALAAVTRDLALSEHRYRALVEAGGSVVWRADADGLLLEGAGWARLTGSLPQHWPGRSWVAAVHAADRPAMAAAWDAARAALVPIDRQFRLARRQQDRGHWVRLRAVPLRDAEGRMREWIGKVEDVTEEREAAALLRLCLGAGRIGTLRYEATTDRLFAGEEARQLQGLPPGEPAVSLQDWLAPLEPGARDAVLAELRQELAARLPHGSIAYCLPEAEGGPRHLEARLRFDYDAEGRLLSALGVLIDVTEQHEAEARIAHIARHDALTGLPNRILFHDRLDQAVAQARRGQGAALLYLDLDRFKEVNDTLGHPVGDALLREVATRLQAVLREGDTLARLGGDEFAVIQLGLEQPQDASRLAQRLVEAISQPFILDGRQVVVGTSIGIALAPGDGLEADQLVKGADMALYRAKSEARGRWRYFEPAMDANLRQRRALEMDLRRALLLDQFDLHYQPIIDIGTREVAGLEALLRWNHPERGLVAPDAFIPLAEEVGLIVPLGEWVLRRACQDAMAWPEALRVAVNLSAAQFASRGLVPMVADALRQSGLAPQRLELEITEAVMLQDNAATLAALHQLKALGLRIAMDDFGTGCSSLSHLQRFPFDKVKIDRSFTRELGRSRQSEAIVQAVTDLCQGLDMVTTAEGVETERQFAALSRQGCREAQGFLFSRPRPAREVPDLLAALRPREEGQGCGLLIP